jgi:tRNA threonylcarbamoyladenosine biosynthesis protein TsaE
MKIASALEMFDLGQRIGSQLQAGDLLLLNGPLGAGKTVLTQGIGAALGFADITSPTFVISRTHKGKLPLIHVDAYRLLESGNAALYLDDLDLDAAREVSVTVIEWGGAESARLSDERLEIDIDRSEDERVITIRTIGPRWAGLKL